MRAIVIQKFGGPESLVIKELPDPEPKPGHVVIQVKAFGINHAEMHMRRGSGPKPQRSAASSVSASSNPALVANFGSGPR